ncbi:2Fe-2S iron-sulfur cluster-binding protein [Novosphingobium sp.]|uniref:2Fe-2S iron-sulfur cluster-binding protein n=1 Tax=Novosphingobium sp. TaxID=1874826 RepID=UPI0027346882|nr:2Fe-2S iron-sulfur cluster-binding protein [Novosphingobium sp.]MDP3905917.1 2Fe-2S iron-sulfur cluster-binding protein [Novosphingobium sp.]
MQNFEHLVTDVTSQESFCCLDGETLLNASVRSGKNIIPVGCRNGGCGMCKIEIVGGDYRTGKMSRAHVTEQEEGQGIVLACRTMPGSSLEIRSKGTSPGFN